MISISNISGKAIIFSAPSGAGKTTVVKHILKEIKNLSFSISACSRKKRKNEINGKDYHFLELNEFKKKNIIETTKFENLKKMENAGLFTENAFDKNNNKKVMFFHKGPENDWKNALDKDLQNKIENNFINEMKELKYI